MTDEHIIKRLNERDETALEAIAGKYGSLAGSLAMRILRDPQDAEECVQDGLMAVWETIPPLQPASLCSYFVALVRNRALDLYKKDHREKRGGGVIAQALEELEDCAAPGSPEDELNARILEERINDYLGRLPERERNIFLRRYYYAEQVSDIAECYGMSPHKVSVLLHRTRNKLKRFLKKEDLL
ncbi:MAG: sigma-70 family RNA polymerase sigma factor [Lachnospiraceae bacterium]|nr:sigma-70 family RNA polymerase sigma factor [Lachnospiraceae bacterium]